MKRYIKNFMMAMMVGATVFGSSCTDSFEEVIQTQVALRCAYDESSGVFFILHILSSV